MAKELGETMTPDELKEMMYQANRTNRDGIVSHDQFMSILLNRNLD